MLTMLLYINNIFLKIFITFFNFQAITIYFIYK